MHTRTTIIRCVLAAASMTLASASLREQAYVPNFDMLTALPELSCLDMTDAGPAARWQTITTRRRSIAKNQFLTVEDSEAALRHFQQIGYDYDSVRTAAQPVPRVYLAKMPSDMPDIEETQMRKRLFLSALLPAMLHVNEEIRETRLRLSTIDACQQAGYTMAQPVQDWIAKLADRYRTEPDAPALLHKIGEIPPSLALAQAAVESGWGTSNPARSFNSLFGQYAVPDDGADKASPHLASYDNILASVRAYADNLNTHRAYAAFRARRLAMIEKNEPVSGLKLAEKLVSYSARRVKYVQDVQRMIRRNGLAALDTVDLAHYNDEFALNVTK